jgi:hypothetical protein
MGGLETYLRSAVLTDTTTVLATDALLACVPDNPSDPYLWLGAFRVLSASTSGDSSIAAAEIVSVAEETNGSTDDALRRVTHRVRTDTLHWRMVMDESGQWRACGLSREGYDFWSPARRAAFRIEPTGASLVTIQASLDSLKRVRADLQRE